MTYNFICPVCGKETEVEIAISNYDKEKDRVICPICSNKMKRIIEWEGITNLNGNGYGIDHKEKKNWTI